MLSSTTCRCCRCMFAACCALSFFVDLLFFSSELAVEGNSTSSGFHFSRGGLVSQTDALGRCRGLCSVIWKSATYIWWVIPLFSHDTLFLCLCASLYLNHASSISPQYNAFIPRTSLSPLSPALMPILVTPPSRLPSHQILLLLPNPRPR